LSVHVAQSHRLARHDWGLPRARHIVGDRAWTESDGYRARTESDGDCAWRESGVDRRATQSDAGRVE
jgi:hypothetical protein